VWTIRITLSIWAAREQGPDKTAPLAAEE
jgi:hypothetical protein